VSQGSPAAFAHASEAEMGRILDFYDVRWEYEPRTFPILWNQDGEVVESFSPDFYLPDLDLFLELTTLKQRLVRKKNRKIRRLRELYPDIQVKLFYARDFRALMLKYGRVALAEQLSGLNGQVGLVHDGTDPSDTGSGSGSDEPETPVDPSHDSAVDAVPSVHPTTRTTRRRRRRRGRQGREDATTPTAHEEAR
jgi:hypothetical protein